MLRGIQRETMRIPCLQRDGAIQAVFHHLAFAKARMDCTADPLAKLCLMVMPIAYLLSFIAADERCALSQRTKACEVLAKLQPKSRIGDGVSADWGLICIAFLRVLDRLSHDISNSANETEDFIDTVDAFVINGGGFLPVLAASGVVGAVSHHLRWFLLQSALAAKLHADVFPLRVARSTRLGTNKTTRVRRVIIQFADRRQSYEASCHS